MEATQAKALLTIIGQAGLSLSTVMATPHAVSAIAELQALALECEPEQQGNNVWIWCNYDKKVEGIKLIRAVAGLGLKEAKDLFEQLNPHANEGWFGPITRAVPEDLNEHLVRYGYLVPERVVQYR
jgi:ribosomal protein L7/L12